MMYVFPNELDMEWQLLCYSVVLTVGLLFVTLGSRVSFSAWFLGTKNSNSLPWLWVAALGIILAANPFSHLEFFYRTSSPAPTSLEVALPTVLTLCLFGPLAEEMFFRGLLFRGLVQRYSPFLSMVIVALLFSAIHRLSWATTLDHILFSTVVTGVYYVTGSVLQVVLLHSISNAAWVLRRTYTVEVRTILDGLGWWYMILPLVGAMLFLVYFRRFHVRSPAFGPTVLQPI